MIHLFYSKGQIFNVKEGSTDIKICFYEYDYNATIEQVDRMIKGGHFAFVTMCHSKPICIEMSPHYNSVIEKKKISHVEINEKITGSDEYVRSLLKICEFSPKSDPEEIKIYEDRCYKMMKDRK